MKGRRNKTKSRTQVLRVWTQAQAQQALPLIASILRSVREHYLEAQVQDFRAQRLSRQPGRPGRDVLIDHADAVRQSQEAKDRCEASLHELLALNVYCQDPVRGLALIPFAHGEQLAWFVFDLFEPERLGTWRFHEDPMATRRPLTELDGTAPKDSLIV
jgi:hypothetical protein